MPILIIAAYESACVVMRDRCHGDLNFLKQSSLILGKFEPTRPDKLLAQAYEALAEPPRPIGSSTACVLVVHQDTLYSANLGDSGYLVIRNGKVAYRSREQTHYFNAPYQLSLLPADAGNLDLEKDPCFSVLPFRYRGGGTLQRFF